MRRSSSGARRIRSAGKYSHEVRPRKLPEMEGMAGSAPRARASEWATNLSCSSREMSFRFLRSSSSSSSFLLLLLRQSVQSRKEPPSAAAPSDFFVFPTKPNSLSPPPPMRTPPNCRRAAAPRLCQGRVSRRRSDSHATRGRRQRPPQHALCIPCEQRSPFVQRVRLSAEVRPLRLSRCRSGLTRRL